MKPIQLSNTSQPAAPQPSGELQYFDWKVYVDEDPEILKTIDHVTYILHPTFPDPVQIVSDASTGFALETSGWGEFAIGAQIQFKNGSVASSSHMLDLGSGK